MKAKILSLVTLIFLLLPASLSAKVYLVAVGISDYPGTDSDLNLPAADAQTIVNLYAQNKDVEYAKLTNSNATVRNITSAMDKTFKKAGKNDVVVLFFSGHGYPGGFVAYDGRLNYDKVRKSMAKSKSSSKMIFADACFSGKIRKDGKAVNSAKKANVMLFLSSRSDETSLERSDMRNGIFTAYIDAGLRGAADANGDSRITAKELFNYVHTNVASISNSRQHPVMWGNFNDNMTIMKW